MTNTLPHISLPHQRVLFLQFAHTADDDRVLHHQAKALHEAGAEVDCLCLPFTPAAQCRHAAQTRIRSFAPTVIICDTPRAVLYSRHFAPAACTIIYDVTEWYPSRKNMANCTPILRPFKACLLALANGYAGIACSAFIFGEHDKARPFALHMRHKPHIFIPYYPDLSYIPILPHRSITHSVRLFFAGSINPTKGGTQALQVANTIALQHPNISFTLTLLTTDDPTTHLSALPANLHIDRHDPMPFREFCQLLSSQDIFLDLRAQDWENNHCLPIKVFYYMAAGRPVIYSDLSALRTAVPELLPEQSLFAPSDITGICKQITRYISSPSYYHDECLRMRQAAEDKYNWQHLRNAFIAFVNEPRKA